ncbi:MAG: hypothetical protein QM756_32255 [Polyangiaceae bacterium]
MRRWLFSIPLFLSMVTSAQATPLRLSLLFEWQRGSQQQSYAGLVVLDLPLERWASPRLPTSIAEEAQPKPPAAAPAPPPRARIRTRPLPARSVKRLLKAALANRADSSVDDRLQSLSSRMHGAALLPELMLRGARSTSETLRLAPTGGSVYDYTQSGGAGLIVEARATWKLDRLVFADEELHVERLRMQREHVREQVVTLLLKQLFAWQRARARLLAEPDTLSDAERAELEAELDGAHAALDLLCDGAFSEELPQLEASVAP